MTAPQIKGSDSAAFEFGPFMLEWFAGNRSSVQLPISSVCNGHCLFCSNQLNPFPVYGGVFREVEDIRLQLCAMAPHDDPLRLSDSLPGRISEGEALLHPRLFEILKIIRQRYFYNTLCFTTNASLLTAEYIERLARHRPIEITVSLHSTVPRHWAKVFSMKERDAETALASLPRLRKSGIGITGTIVTLPNVCGWEDIERTYRFFVENGSKRMILYWPGFTRQTPEALLPDLACPIEEFTEFAERMKSEHRVPLDAFPDMASPLRVSVETVRSKTLRGNPATSGRAYRTVVWLASRAAFDRLSKMVSLNAESFPNRHHVIAVDNLSYGGNIISSGLLMAEDYIRAGKAALKNWPDTELFLVPSESFDGLFRDLSGIPAYSIEDRLDTATWIVRNDGTMDPLLHLRLTRRRKSPHGELREMMDRFNAGLEDPNAIPEGLDLIASFPLPAPEGCLTREQYRHRIDNDRRRFIGPKPVSQAFEFLDDTHALCIETWDQGAPGSGLRRWTRLVKNAQGWRIESIAEGIAASRDS